MRGFITCIIRMIKSWRMRGVGYRGEEGCLHGTGRKARRKDASRKTKTLMGT
jgi:hypothetical protein